MVGLKVIFSNLIQATRAAAMIYTAILLPALIGFVGLGIDVSLWELRQREAQNIADAAAIAGSLEIVRQKENPDYEGAVLVDAVENRITINKPPLSGSYTSMTNAVEVIVEMEGRALFSSVLGVENPNIAARSVALGAYNSTCLWSLNETEPSTIDVNGSSNVEFSCGVFANSSDPGPQLRSQYFGESVLMALGAYAASIFLAYWFGPYITAMANTSIDLLGGGYWFEIMFGFIGAFFIGIFAGLYPVFVVGRGQVSRQSPCVCDS